MYITTLKTVTHHAYFVANSQVDGDGKDDAATELERGREVRFKCATSIS